MITSIIIHDWPQPCNAELDKSIQDTIGNSKFTSDWFR